MKYELQQNLGLDDVKYCNRELRTSLPLDARKLAAGSIVELSDAAAEWLTVKKGYSALLEPADKIKGIAKQPEIASAK